MTRVALTREEFEIVEEVLSLAREEAERRAARLHTATDPALRRVYLHAERTSDALYFAQAILRRTVEQ
jgi:BMFP domain-containing protein YqiC